MSMGGVRGTVREAQREAEQRVRTARPWLEPLARVGFGAKGVVYLTVGLLALRASMGGGGKTTDARGALYSILHQPYGQVLLGILAVGLFGYAVWRFIQAGVDPGEEEQDAKRLVKRTGYALGGVAYGGLGLTAVRLLTEGRDPGSGRSVEEWTAWVLAQPFGQWLVGLAGVVVVGIGLNALVVALTGKFREKLRRGQMSDKWTTWAGRLGYTARGVVFGLIGFFLVQAALRTDPNQARGLGGALQSLAQQPYGPWLLGLTAAGLAAYGLYTLASARYRRIWS